MGITGLLPFLQNTSEKCHISKFRGCTVAIDSYCWLHKAVFSCADRLAMGEKTTVYVNYIRKYLTLLHSYDIRPILVFDGQNLAAKKKTELKRREQRKAAKVKAIDLCRQGRNNEARQYFKQSLDITHEIAFEVIKECRSLGVDCIVAPFEADAQLAFLNMQNIAHVVITEDSDLVLFGCKKILFKFDLTGQGVLVEQSKLHLAMKMNPDTYNFDKFRYMCIISGCDYLDSLPGIGLKRAYNAVKMTAEEDIYKLLPRLGRYLNMNNLVITDDYIEDFKLADATFRYQIVFDPLQRQLVRLTSPEESGIEAIYLRNAGDFMDKDEAFQMALGNINPMTKEKIDDWHPDFAGVQDYSIWSKNYRKTCPKIMTQRKLTHSVTKYKNVLVDTNAFCEKSKQIYDEQLEEELKTYKLVSLKTEENCDIEDTSEELSQVKISPSNCFVKTRRKISKFPITNLEEVSTETSSFFGKPETSLENDKALSPVLYGESRKRLISSESDEDSNEQITSGSRFMQFRKKTTKFADETDKIVTKFELKTEKETYSKLATLKLYKGEQFATRLNEDSDLENLTPPQSSLESASSENIQLGIETTLNNLNRVSESESVSSSQESKKNVPLKTSKKIQPKRVCYTKTKTCSRNQPTLLSMFEKIGHK